MRIDDTVGPDVDPALKGVLVVFNSTGSAVTQQVPGADRRQPVPVPRPGRRLGPGREADDLDRVVRHRHRPGALGRRTGPDLTAPKPSLDALCSLSVGS